MCAHVSPAVKAVYFFNNNNQTLPKPNPQVYSHKSVALWRSRALQICNQLFHRDFELKENLFCRLLPSIELDERLFCP